MFNVKLLALLLLSLVFGLASAADLNDPMRPPDTKSGSGTKRTAAARYRLDAIVLAPERRLAIINGRRLALGERIGNATLTDIRATEVTVRIAGKPQVLTLLPLSIKTPSSEATNQ